MHMTPVRARLLAGLAALLTAGSVAGSALPAAASPGKQVLTYVALGDSYAAGQATSCAHTESSYPLRLDALHRVKLLRNVTCAGATTGTVEGSQIDALTPGTKLVTVTVGANDLHLDAIAAACAADPTTGACATAVASAEAGLPSLYGDLVATYRAIAEAAPHAVILVTGYPQLVTSDPIASAEALLNATIARAVATAAASGVDIRYVPVDFSGHTLEAGADSWFYLSGPDAFHPNAAGEAAIARALAAAL